MNELINRVQKDLNKLQATFEKEGEVLLEKIRKSATKAEKNVNHKKDEVATLIEKQIKKFEPALEKFYQELKVNAGKYGVDLTDIEKKVKTTTKRAATKLKKKSSSKKKSTKKKAVKKKVAKKKTAKKPAKKTAAKKKVAKKATKKKSTTKTAK